MRYHRMIGHGLHVARQLAALGLMLAWNTSPVLAGTVYFLSPTGNDLNTGVSVESPWLSFSKVLNPAKPLGPGDVVVLLDGQYTRATTGLPTIDCRATGTARSGTAAEPISLVALGERRAHLRGDGRTVVLLRDCEHWTVHGLYASNVDTPAVSSVDGFLFRVVGGGHIRLQKLLAVHPNRLCPNASLPYCNVHTVGIEHAHDVLVEDVESYDYHRHGPSAFLSNRVVFRRAYSNTRLDTVNPDDCMILYGSSDSIMENCICENTDAQLVNGLNIAGTGPTVEGTPGGFRNRILGSIRFEGQWGTTVRARNFGSGPRPAESNTITDSVYVGPQDAGIVLRGAFNTLVENVTLIGSDRGSGLAVSEDVGEPAPCAQLPNGCSFTARNVLSIEHGGRGAAVQVSTTEPWLIEYSRLAGNAGGDFPTTEPPGDLSGHIQRSSSARVTGIGVDANECLLWIPDGHELAGAGKNGADIGATVLYRYVDGALTTQPLWDPATGAFPCGAVVAGVNDVPGSSCATVHERLNVNRNGCPFPEGYAVAKPARAPCRRNGECRSGKCRGGRNKRCLGN
jgi:hypothetical protein